MEKSKYQKLLDNSIVFSIGNFGSKLLVFLMVPFYTFYLTTHQYGTVDLITTTASVLMPLVMFNVYDAVLRFVMDKGNSKEEVLTNSCVIFILSVGIAVVFETIIKVLGFDQGNSILFLFLIILVQGFQSMVSQYVRGIGRVKLYAGNGILLAFCLSILNIVLLAVFKMGIDGYLLSIIISNMVSIIHLFFSVKFWRYLNLSLIDKGFIRKMLKYSLPLIPNSIMWWLMNTASKYFVLFFIGTSANGLLAVASKIPGIISLLNSIFFQAWQLSAIEEYDSEGKSEFYTTIFKYFSFIMFVAVALLLVMLKPLMNLMNPSYFEAWKIVPFLLISVTFSSLSSFLGTNYIAAKETIGVFSTTIIGSIISIVINFITIPFLGINSVGIGTMISFIIIFYLRYKDTKRFVVLTIDWKKFIISQLILLMEIMVLFIKVKPIIQFTLNIMLIISLLIVNKSTLISISNNIFRKVKK